MERIKEAYLRIPSVILTATPANINSDYGPIKIYKKGDLCAGYEDILNYLYEIYNTGLTRIMGGRGVFEKTLNKVFLESLCKNEQINKWIEYGKNDQNRTERALMRHTLNHLLNALDDNMYDNQNNRLTENNEEDIIKNFPEEMYLYPISEEIIKTGSIITHKNGEEKYVIMTPACDLAKRKSGDFKTDNILLVEIDKKEMVINSALVEIVKKHKKGNKLNSIFGNNHTDYYHWLANTDFFEGGFLNFRKLLTINKDDFEQLYRPLKIQISQAFVKDIVARFSSYYARQGQPDIDSSVIIKSFIEN